MNVFEEMEERRKKGRTQQKERKTEQKGGTYGGKENGEREREECSLLSVKLYRAMLAAHPHTSMYPRGHIYTGFKKPADKESFKLYHSLAEFRKLFNFFKPKLLHL